MYSLPGCPFCIKAKLLLDKYGVDVEEINVSTTKGKKELMQRGDFKTVPQIFVSERHVGGYDDLTELVNKGTFNKVFGLE